MISNWYNSLVKRDTVGIDYYFYNSNEQLIVKTETSFECDLQRKDSIKYYYNKKGLLVWEVHLNYCHLNYDTTSYSKIYQYDLNDSLTKSSWCFSNDTSIITMSRMQTHDTVHKITHFKYYDIKNDSIIVSWESHIQSVFFSNGRLKKLIYLDEDSGYELFTYKRNKLIKKETFEFQTIPKTKTIYKYDRKGNIKLESNYSSIFNTIDSKSIFSNQPKLEFVQSTKYKSVEKNIDKYWIKLRRYYKLL